jgi:hypothetical protein
MEFIRRSLMSLRRGRILCSDLYRQPSDGDKKILLDCGRVYLDKLSQHALIWKESPKKGMKALTNSREPQGNAPVCTGRSPPDDFFSPEAPEEHVCTSVASSLSVQRRDLGGATLPTNSQGSARVMLAAPGQRLFDALVDQKVVSVNRFVRFYVGCKWSASEDQADTECAAWLKDVAKWRKTGTGLYRSEDSHYFFCQEQICLIGNALVRHNSFGSRITS